MKTQHTHNPRRSSVCTLRPIAPTTTQLLLAAILCLFPALTRAETAVQAWVQRYNGPANSADQASAIAVDGSNNVIVTGWSYVGIYSDYTTIKYSNAGVPLWTNIYDGPGNSVDWAYAIAVDGSNNVIVTGGPGDYLTIKYSSAGLALWTNRYNGPANGDDRPRALAVDGSNNVIVTGYAIGSGSDHDYATVKYSSAGLPLWTNRYNGPGNGWDQAEAVAVDGSNNVIVTGYSLLNSTNNEYATIKYSSAGVPLWTNRYNGPRKNANQAYALAVDGSNNVIVTGESDGSGSGRDYATIKYSSAGVPLWTNRYNGPGNGYDIALAVAVDGSNNVLVAGYSSNGTNQDYATIKYSSAGVPLWTNRYQRLGNVGMYDVAVAVDGSNNVIVAGHSSNGTNYDYATIKYSSAGEPLWTKGYNGPGNGSDQAANIVLDCTGNVFVTGYSTGSGGDYDFATIKYICVRPPVMTGLNLFNGTFQMRVDEVLQPGTLVIEASTNLTGWEAIFTNTTPTNVLFYTDPDAGSYLWRFYRAYQFP